MKGGSVEFDFKGNTNDIEKKVSGLESKLKSIASTGGKALLGLGVASTTALITITKKAVMAQGELEQQIGGTEAVFGKYAKTVQEESKKAYSSMGVSANEYMQYINKMGSLMKGSGIDTQRAMDLSSQAMQRASDVASIMGISVDDAMTAISGAAKGNFTMMDNLGVAMNATSLEAYALEKGIKKSYKAMTQAEKVELAMQMFLEKSAYASGNYAKENKTLVGSLTTLKASFTNLLSGTGTLDEFLNTLQNFGTILAQKLITIMPQVVQGIVGLINGIIPMLPQLVQAILPALIQGVVALTVGIIEVLPDIVQMIADMLPTLMPQIVDAILTIIPALIKCTPQFLKAGWELIKGLAVGIFNARIILLEKIVEIGTKLIDKIKGWWTDIKKAGGDLIKGLWQGISDKTQWIVDKIKGFKDKVMNALKKFFGIASPSKEFAIIGKYNIMGLEEGMQKESLKLQDGFDKMFSLSPNLYGTSSTNLSPQINVINNISMKQDSLGQMVNDIKTFSGGAKNDYSYGMGA